MARSDSIPVPANATPELAAALLAVERFVADRDLMPRLLPSFTVAELLAMDASDWTDCAVICSNETGGRTIATSNGTHFCRVKDGATVS